MVWVRDQNSRLKAQNRNDTARDNHPLSDRQIRVLQALRRRGVDQVPKGEFGIEADLCQRIIDIKDGRKVKPECFSEMSRLIRVLEILAMDFTAVNPGLPSRQQLGRDSRGRKLEIDFWGNQVAAVGVSKGIVVPACSGIAELVHYQLPGLERVDFGPIKRWSQETPFFIFTQVPGPFSLIGSLTSFLDFLGYTVANPNELKNLAVTVGKWLGELIGQCISFGAQGIVITDDLAYDRGPWINLKALEQLFFPVMAELVSGAKQRGIPVVLHCDGDVRSLLPYVAGMGFDGIHSLQPSAGNDLGEIKVKFGSRLCLMGNLDCNYLLPEATVSEVVAATCETLQVGSPGGGYILSSCAGILSGDWPAENILAMYQTAEKFSIRNQI